MSTSSLGMGFWAEMGSRGPETAVVGGVTLGPGSRVRLRPRSRSDVFDLALDGMVAVVEAVELDDGGGIHLAVTVDGDPGRDLGDARFPGHRFFFAPEDVEPLDPGHGGAPAPRVLVAGIGNVFLGDDGFGVEVVRRLGRRQAPPGVDVVDFGIRGMDLVYALQRGYDAAILIDAAPRGEAPGTLSVIEPDQVTGVGGATVDAHGMDPVRVLRLARELGRVPARTLVVACEPATTGDGAPDGVPGDVLVALSEPVRSAVGEAVRLVESLVAELIGDAAAARAARTPDAHAPTARGPDAREPTAHEPTAHAPAAREPAQGRDACAPAARAPTARVPEARGRDAHGSAARGSDACGSDAHGLDAHGSDAHAPTAHGSDVRAPGARGRDAHEPGRRADPQADPQTNRKPRTRQGGGVT